MALSTGDKLGPYEILAPLGAGGMGEVYKARDTRLDRTVAVKVLPEHIAKREDLRARFEREARAVASLKHPNICVLHDIGSQDGAGYMVMEFMEGETLAARIAKGALPLDQALKFATQIADALDRAHRAGVTHRDVKPQNIMLTRDGAKVLDFGLAKSIPKPGPTDETLTAVLTTEGTVMGTPQYMAPEQFEGKEADARSDIWAFGAVLYEMVTGQKAFQGKSYSSLLGAILSADPPPMSVKPFTPVWLERLVRRCLAKDPEDRWQTMRDVVIELQTPPQESIAAPPSKAARWPWAALAFGVLAFASLGFSAWQWFHKPPVSPTAGAVHLFLPPPDNTVLTSLGPNGPNLALSPDGRFLAFIGEQGAKQQLWVLTLSTGAAQLLDRAEAPARPFWSPDSQNIAFFTGDKMKRVPVTGGPSLDICDAIGEGGAWNSDGVIVFSADGVLKRVPAGGGVAVPITQLDAARQETRHAWPQFLPDGRLLFLSQSRQPGQTGIFVKALGASASKEPRTMLAATETRALFAAPDQLLYVRADATLVSQTVDLQSMKMLGEAVPLAQQLRANIFNGRNAFSISSNGMLAYRSGGMGGQSQLARYARDGKRLETILPFARNYRVVELSPDNRWLAVEKGVPGNWDLWAFNMSTKVFSQLTFGSGEERYPVWSPDSRSIAYRDNNGVGRDSIRRLELGSSNPISLPITGNSNIPTDWTNKGLIYTANLTEGVWLLPDPLDPKPESAVRLSDRRPVRGGLSQFRVSPNGLWIVYTSQESGTAEVFVGRFPGLTDTRQISSGGGTEPRWRKDGREIFYLAPDRSMMSVEASQSGGGTLETSAPKALFLSNRSGTPSTVDYGYDVTSDGQQFIIEETDVGNETEAIHVIVNWKALLAH